MKKYLLFWVYLLCFICLGLYFPIQIKLYHNNQKTKTINITNYYTNEPIEELNSVFKNFKNTNFSILNTQNILNYLNQIVWIKDIIIKKNIYGVIDIKIIPHKIIAILKQKDNVYYITKENILLPFKDDITQNQKYLTFKDNEKSFDKINFLLNYNVYNTVQNLQKIKDKIDYIERIEQRRFNVVTKNKITIMLSENNELNSINKIIQLDEQYNILSKKIKKIDLRDVTKILIEK